MKAFMVLGVFHESFHGSWCVSPGDEETGNKEHAVGLTSILRSVVIPKHPGQLGFVRVLLAT